MRDNINRVAQYNSILYATAAAIMVVALDKDNFIFCLIPYVVIFPLYILAESDKKGQCNLAAYLAVFYEGQEYHWEIRHYKYAERSKTIASNNKKSPLKRVLKKVAPRLDYFSMNLVCSFAAIYKIVCGEASYSIKWLQAISVIVLTATIITIMAINATDYVIEHNKAIKQWKAIKAAEEAQKLENIRNPQ